MSVIAGLLPTLSPARRGSPDSLRVASFWVLALVCLVSVALLGVELLDEQKQKSAEIQRIATSNANLASSLAQQAEDTLEMADTALVGVVERLEIDGQSPHALDRLKRVLDIKAAALPRVHGFFVYGEDGRWLTTSLPSLPANTNYADRDYFRYHRASADKGPHIGLPVRSKAEGQWIITVSRRFNHPDGSFAGVVNATIDVSYFASIHNKLDLGRQGTVVLFHSSGKILSRVPSDESYLGRDQSKSALFAEHLPKAPAGTYRLISPLDGLPRILGYKTGERFPVVAVVTVGEDEALADWRSSAVNGFVIACLLIAGIVMIGVLLMRKLNHLQAMQAALTANEANFRLLAESAGDMVSRVGHDHVLRYVSPASAPLLGRQPSEMVDRSFDTYLDGEGREAFRHAVVRLHSADEESVSITHRSLHADGSRPWLETTLRVARDAKTGVPDGLVTVSRDVTERKVYETQLASLASTDALTGIANRRTFDATLESECRRAVRDGTPVSLILFDLDRFKTYNDTYGHTAGDAALFAVAAAISGSAHRPGDLAARYGGEELALILPGTELSGAITVAERIRSEIEALGITHVANTPAGVVTVSGGVADLRGEARAWTGNAPLSLVNAADEALYRAKKLGRNAIEADRTRTIANHWRLPRDTAA